MQQFAALLASAFVAASGFVAPTQKAVSADPSAEVYVAELDADWNVAREIRVPCDTDTGCAVDLGGPDAALPRVHVRFDAIRGGAVEVSSRIEDRAGGALVEPGAVVKLDRTGFGAAHVDAANATGTAGDAQRIILFAVRAPGWLATQSAPLVDGTHI